MPEERKLVTVLFADIVGSTAFGREHDAELVRGRLRDVFADMRSVLLGHGASVEKFIGDAVMAVFGVPRSHEDDAERALRAAFEIRERLGRAGVELPLSVRIGITTGEAVADTSDAGEFLVTGEVVNAAARLQQLAGPGEILIGPLTRDLTEHVGTFGSARQLRAKGIPVLEAWPALAFPRSLDRELSLTAPRAPLIGRKNELRLLRDTYRHVQSEERAHLVTVFGSPGIGKSRLAGEFVREIGSERARLGRCLPYGKGITFYPVERILQAEAGIVPSEPAEVAEAKVRATVLARFDAAEEGEAVAARVVVAAGLGSAERHLAQVAARDLAEELRWGVRRYFEAVASRGPLVLVFEDIHWAEPGLLELIEHLADWGRAPLFILCLARPELLDVRSDWGGGRTNATAIRLEPLTDQEARELMVAVAGDVPLPDALARQILDRSEGNPLFVEEFGHFLLGTPEGSELGRDPSTGYAIPPTIHALIAARLDQAPRDVKRWLQIASVLGRVFWRDGLAEVTGTPGPDAEVVRDAVRRGLISESDEGAAQATARAYRFKHAIVREVAYGSLPKAERALLHDRCGRWYEEKLGERRVDFIDVIAHHAEQAFRLASEVRHPRALELGERALDRAWAAASRARDRGDARSAKTLYATIVEIARAVFPNDPRLAQAEAHLAIVQHQLEPTAQNEATLDRAIEILRPAGPSETLVLLLVERARSIAPTSPIHDEPDHRGQERLVALVSEAEAAARAIGDPLLLGQVVFLSTVRYLYDRTAYRAAVARALVTLRSGDSTQLLFECMTAVANAEAEAGAIGDSLRIGKEAYELARKSGTRMQRLRTTEGIAGFHRFAGDYAAAVGFGEEALRLGQEVGTWELASSLMQLGLAYTFSGEPARARALLEPYVARLGSHFPFQALVWVCLELGDHAAARRYARGGLEATRTGRMRVYLEILLALAEGEVDSALAIHRRFTSEHRFGWGFFVGEWGPRIARALLAAGRPVDAAPLLNDAIHFYSDPGAYRRRSEIEALMESAGVR